MTPGTANIWQLTKLVAAIALLGFARGAGAAPTENQDVSDPTPLSLDLVDSRKTGVEPVLLDNAPPDLHFLDGFRFSLTGEYLYGRADGFAQIPAGGQPGSTSHNRPRLGEIGIHDVNGGDVQFLAQKDVHGLFVGAQFLNFSGSAVLGSDLVSHGVTFPAGTHVSSDLNLDWYRIGYQYHADLGHIPGGELSLIPSIAGALFDFSYKLTGAGERAARSFSKATVLGGIDLRYSTGVLPLTFDAMLAGTPPVSALPQLYQERVTATYRFLNDPRFSLDGVVGLGFEQFDFQDRQRVSNHVRIDVGPSLILGVRVEF